MATAAPSFDEQLALMSASVSTESEQSILELLKTGLAESKPTQTIAVVRRWLRQNVANDPMLLYHAGQAAELSGDWRGAVALYQQYLKRADLKSQEAAEAVFAVYTLLLDQLSDTEGAYAYMSNEGHRLHVCGRAKQFDKWYLDLAVKRRDHQAVADRLLACVKDPGTTDDLLVASYEGYFRWLLYEISGWNMEWPRFSEEFAATVKQLAKEITFDEELKLRLAWVVAVKKYNMNLIDGNQAELPIDEANALLAKYPQFAEMVQTGWAERRGRYYKDDPKKYWPVDVEAKLASVKAAAAKLKPFAAADFYLSWSNGYYDSGPTVLGVPEARQFVLDQPKIVNNKVGPLPNIDWRNISLEEARKLAPVLDQNPSSEASMVWAIVAGGDEQDFDKAVAALLGPEVWRLGPGELSGSAADQLWHKFGRPGGNSKRDQAIARGKAIAATFAKGDVTAKDPTAKRVQVFKNLWNDFRSPKPKTPAVRSRLEAVLQVTPEAIPELLRDPSPLAQMLVRKALTTGFEGIISDNRIRGLSPRKYDPWILRVAKNHRGMDWLQQYGKEQGLYIPYPLEPALRSVVAERLKKGKLEPWLVMAWINAQFPEDNADSVALMSALYRSPVFETLPYEVRFGARQWFQANAMTPQQFAFVEASDARLVCKELTALMQPPQQEGEVNAEYQPDVAKTTAAIKSALEGVQRAPVRLEIVGLDELAKVDEAVLFNPQVTTLLMKMAGPMRTFHRESNSSALDDRLWEYFAKQANAEPEEAADRGLLLHQTAPYFWRHTERFHRKLPSMIEFSDGLTESQPSAASAWARCGLQTIARHRSGHTYYNRETDIPRLTSIRGKAALSIGLIEIPVPANHPAYSVYRSQAEFVIGNEESAIELYENQAEQLLEVHRELSVSYLLWVLHRMIDARDEVGQEQLVKALRQWSQESATAFSLEERLALDLAYGDIAMQRSMLPEAHKIYAGIESNEAFQDMVARHTATLRRVRVERIGKDFEAALASLDRLEAEKIPQLVTAAHHARAEVFYDMEEYEDAADEIAKVLKRDPSHSEATILRGRVQLKRKRLIEATEVELGSVAQQASLVPGEVLKVTLNDPTLSVSSGGTEVEVVVWATSGDKEQLLLRQFGDEKTKYRGDVRTALGEPKPGDRTLQVVGDDEVYYAYSESFRAKVTNLGENRGGPIKVASDGMLMASARRLLSANEQRVADMEAVTAALEDKGNQSLNNADPELVARIKAEAAAAARRRELEARVKPGNPIHLRVIDSDRSRTPEVDELVVSISSSSGDTVGRVLLKETGTHTGQFEGQLATASAQAAAFATSSETGRNPNMVISPNDTYEAWRPIPQQVERPVFTVDLNDNAELGKLNVVASDPGFGLKSFVLQTAMNRRQWTTVATFPRKSLAVPKPWNPSVTVLADTDRYQMGRKSAFPLSELQEQLEYGWLTQRHHLGTALNVAGPSEAMPETIPTAVEWKRQSHHSNCHVVYRFQAWFYEPANVTRRFRLNLGPHQTPKGTHASLTSPPQFLLAVDGRAITEEDGKLDGTVNLRAGLHRFEIWGIGWVQSTMGFGRTTSLEANLEGEDELVPCPDDFFDPTTFPAEVLEHRNAPAEIEASDNGTQFAVKFADKSRARLMRLVFLDQEGQVPSLNRLALTAPQGNALLPVPEDFAELRKNKKLEILTGDRITVRYVDDRYVTKGKQKHERFLNVAFTNGRIEFADIEPRFSQRHGRKMPYYERLLRFEHGKPFPVVIHDADMDVSVEPDEVTWRAMDGDGNEHEYVAIESGPSTGTFRTLVTPVATKGTTDNEIYVPVGSTLEVIYRDAENDSPGVPTDRFASSQHAELQSPVIQIADMKATLVEPTELGPLETLNTDFIPDFAGRSATAREQATMERIRSRYDIHQTFLDATETSDIEVVHGRAALIDVIAPHLALRTTSSIEVYLQTDSGRKLARVSSSDQGFDTDVPGTIRVEALLGQTERLHPGLLRAGYRVVSTTGDGLSKARLETERIQEHAAAGRFRIQVPLIAGDLPEESYADPQRVRELKLERQYGLTVRTGERIHVGVRYKDLEGKTQWITALSKVVSHPMLDVMQEGYRQQLTEAFVGEQVYLRVLDLDADRTDGRDAVRCFIASKSGQKHYADLRETGTHTGIFKGNFQLTYVSEKAEEVEDYNVRRSGFPVVYGDSIGIRYTDAAGRKTPPQYVVIGKGSDGMIAPFSKQYEDSEVAMQTQFAMAESYLELARRHRQTGEATQAAREFTRAKQLLENAVSQYTDPETRAHAEYLLGGLTQEDAEGTTDAKLQRQRYQAALARFMTITGSYADTDYASKAQFKIARIYEALQEPEIAAQEYVKLAYKYPESEHLATAMARLGTHFQRKALVFERQAAPFLTKAEQDPEDKDAAFEGEALQKMSQVEYMKSAQIFERLQTRFPDHELAGKAGLRAGQIYMRAEEYTDAIVALLSVVNNEAYDGPTLRSEAMYWAGKAHQSLNQQLQAYALYKRITYDFPESKWAAYARGELSTERLLRLDRQLEIERLEEGTPAR